MDSLQHQAAAMSLTPRYSHEATVKAITSFYEMLMRAHSDKSGELLYPPPTGWPQITQDSFAPLGRTDEVVELMRHLPYFSERIQVLDETEAIKYTDDKFCEQIDDENRQRREQGMTDGEPCPPEVFCLADRGEECEYGYTLFIDTKFGYAVLEREFGEIPNYVEPEDEEDLDDQYQPAWMEGKEYVALPIESFFEMCKRQLRIMNWTPHLEKGSWGELEERPSTQSTIDPMMRVMIEAGWPGDGDGRGWNKKKAERDMQELWIA